MKKILALMLIFLLSFSLLSQERGIGLREDGRPSLQSFYRESWALVVGINDYLRAPKLRYAVNDAKAIVDILVNSYGFKRENVIELYDKDATKENIMRAFDRLRRLASENDRVFIFFAGHGITEVLLDGRERGFILPYEGSKAEVLTTAISTDQLNEISLFIKAKHLFIVMDACYGGLIFARAQPISAEALDYVKIISTRVARKALTAGGRDQPVFDTGPGGHSIFTYYFVDGLKTMSADLNRDGIITTSELMDYVGPRVTAESKGVQTPEYGVLLGDKGGDFVFIPVGVVDVSMGMDVALKPGRLTIVSNVDGADVYVDNRMIGKLEGNKFTLDLKPGKHLVELRKDRYTSARGEVLISPGEAKEVKFTLSRSTFSVNVKTEPEDALVYVNDKLLGKGSFRADVEAGKVKFRVEREGYEAVEREVVVDRDDLELKFVLNRIVVWTKMRLNGNSVLSVAFEGDYVWLGTTNGLVKLNRFTGEKINYNKSTSGLPSDYVRAILIDSQGHKWIGTYGGLAKFDGVRWTVYNTSNLGLPSDNVYAIAVDSDGNKWIGTGKGLAKFDGVRWTVYNTSNSDLPSDNVYAIAIDGQGNKWIGTWGGGVAKFDGVKWTLYNTSNSGLPSNNVYTIVIDSNGNKWIGTDGGVAKFDGANWIVYNASNSGLPSDNIYAIAMDSEGTKWIGTNGGVTVYRENGVKPFPKPYAYFYSNKLDFGKLYLGEINRLGLKVSNDGGSELKITDVSVKSSSFKFLGKLPIVLNRGDSVNLSFLFSPSSVGFYVDTVLVYSNSHSDSVFKVILVGSGEGSMDRDAAGIIKAPGEEMLLALGFGLLLLLLILILGSG
ncbi:two-component regulator propeller domain-containing protein [Candidatus Kryptonium thompsonii]|uniref:two-component regulator propeller domain-containing protein n=1 Tax=Candidatus Kryptonium thompsonii TaxID=1633631 RepID=UPI000707F9E2|nr:two-component regulator propeller domain-containing protein [Candidatus Kryptonium thompsoni]CUT01972.1 Two component regulator propeller [Candidatus Kryptonium thompsoni]